MMNKPALGVLIRAAAGIVLCYAGFYKAVGPSAEFAATIMNYHVVPSFVATLVAYVLPWIELSTGTMLILGYSLPWSSRLAEGLFGLFLVVLISAFIRGIDLSSCGCFGTAILLDPKITATMDALLLVGTGLFNRLGASPLSLDRWIASARS